MIKTKAICKCGHKLKDHRADLKECYVHKNILGSNYKCTCNGFEEKEATSSSTNKL